ncbi:MAG: pirin family protein [Methanomassiliicoccales archaeon]|nr:pirin family protein [Methanomassiliicoccales archaeon]
MKARSVTRVLTGRPTLEGAGVHLFRVFGYGEVKLMDPFLMLDDFHSSNPDDYLAGFPIHPHRGMETVTYIISGKVEHQDSLGNRGEIGSGDLQWMTAGSGIMHQEMPRRWEGFMQGFQLWVNLPRKHKMMQPRYRDVKKESIPLLEPEKGVEIKLIAGELQGMKGPVQDLVVPVECLDVRLSKDAHFSHDIAPEHNAFAYVFEGSGIFSVDEGRGIRTGQAVVFGEGDHVHVSAADGGVRFLLASGHALHEPIAWNGPIVMNTSEELELASSELRAGTFVKAHPQR